MAEQPWLERTLVRVEDKPNAGRKGRNGPKFGSGRLLVYLPDGGHSNEDWLRAVVGAKVPLQHDDSDPPEVWDLAAKHMLAVAAAMADRYGEVDMCLQISPTMKCSYSCQTKGRPDTVWDCVCQCGGRHHSGKGYYDDWYSTGRFRIERQGDIEIRHLLIRRGQLPWGSDAAPEQLRSMLPAPSAPPVPRPILRSVPTPSPVPAAPHPRPEPRPVPLVPLVPPSPDLGRTPSPDWYLPTPDPVPHIAVPESPKRKRTGPLIAVAAVIAVIGLGLWLLVPMHTSDKPRTGQSPPIATVQDAPAAPPPPAAEEPTPPPVKPPAPTWRGCYPLQPNC
ncbi:hypothetical protein [Nocardia sp. alder85J]|uniref:hypothetical protein n=1 Tax=Nocardia sp. alder85J TaxID=2862949 RepID=UPI001CD509BA|nr:hypothetical protein [Nocardia sp. alder85J]MCX4099226.1 hypothetical protein [Nocardia sp. alder85J]